MTPTHRRLTLLLVVALLAALASGLLWARHNTNADTQTDTIATISVDGEERYRFDLAAIHQTQTLTIGEPGHQNIIEVSPHGIGVIRADCPDQTCVRQGIRSHGPSPIVCLPHHLTITFSDDNDLDAAT